MSKIIITSTNTAPGSGFIAGLKGIVGTGLSDLQMALKSGAPIFEQELFLNNHEEVADKLRKISSLGERSGIRLKYFELQPGENFETCPLAACEISAEILENILVEWELSNEKRMNTSANQ